MGLLLIPAITAHPAQRAGVQRAAPTRAGTFRSPTSHRTMCRRRSTTASRSLRPARICPSRDLRSGSTPAVASLVRPRRLRALQSHPGLQRRLGGAQHARCADVMSTAPSSRAARAKSRRRCRPRSTSSLPRMHISPPRSPPPRAQRSPASSTSTSIDSATGHFPAAVSRRREA